jgi:hypothetical protein
LGPPLIWNEQMGDPITNLGGAVIPAPRAALRHSISLATFETDALPDTVAARLTNRRQLRSLLNNTPLKMAGGIYILYSDDPEQNGWYVPDQGQLADIDGASGLATGVWKLENVVWFIAGHARTHREARNVWMKDLRAGLWPRDTLRMIYSTDFSALSTLSLSILPSGATGIVNAVSAQVVASTAQLTGRDGGQCPICNGVPDLATISYDRPESSQTLSDVIVYDRRGQITAPSGGPDTSWEEVYGPDYPWNWLTVGQPNDTPVLDNGLVRVRYDGTGTPGFRVDVWTGSAYVEQGKMLIYRGAVSTGYVDTWIAAGLIETTGDRVIMACQLSASWDAASRERIFITMTRGVPGCTFEIYPALRANGTQADAGLYWYPAVADTNTSIIKVDYLSGGAKAQATAGSGSANYAGGPTTIGNTDFTQSENWLALLRCSATSTLTAYQMNLGVLQVQTQGQVTNNTNAYGSGRNGIGVMSLNQAGWVSTDISFVPTSADQVLEAESITLGTGTANTVDANASNGHAATATRTTDANLHVSRATWPNGTLGKYRIVIRVKTSAGTGSFYATTSATTTTTMTTTSTTYIWLDLGVVTGEVIANNSTLEIHAWTSSGTVSVDRIEAYLAEDRTAVANRFAGARDLGSSILQDARFTGALVAR